MTFINKLEFYLKCRVNSRKLPEHGNTKHLCHQMCPEQVCDCLVVVEVTGADPDLSQQPVVLTISWQEDGVVFTWNLAKLKKTSVE